MCKSSYLFHVKEKRVSCKGVFIFHFLSMTENYNHSNQVVDLAVKPQTDPNRSDLVVNRAFKQLSSIDLLAEKGPEQKELEY